MKATGISRLKLVGIAVVLVVLICGSAAFGATYYVAPSGSDSSSGTASAPFRTIQKAANVVNPGDTVIVRDGTYTDTDGDKRVVKLSRGGNASAWVTFRAENKWGAVIDGQNNAADYCIASSSVNASYIVIQDFEIRGCDDSALFFNLGEGNIAITGNYIHDIARKTNATLVGFPAIYTGPGCSSFLFDSNVFETIGRLNPGTTPPAPASSCTTPPDYVYNGVAYPNLSVCYNHDHGLYLKSTDNTIINNIFLDHKSGWPVLMNQPSSLVYNNTFVGDNPGRVGQVVVQSTGAEIYNNIFFGDADCGVVTYSSKVSGAIKNNLFYPAIDIRCNAGGYTPQGTWTISGNILNQDPRFAAPSSHDYHLLADSPAIDRGLIIAGYDHDADGNPISGLPDIGAYEYIGDLSDTIAPSVPTGLSAAAVSSSQINLAWTASTDNVGVTGYRVYRNGSLVATTTAAAYADTGLAASTTYTYRVSAFDAAGNVSAQSSAASATTQAAPDTTPPTVPAGLTATVISSTQINLSWTPSTDNVGVTGYRVYVNGSLTATTTQPNYSDTGLTPSTTYTYRVSAFDAAGNLSAQSAAVSATTQAAPDTTPPTVPAGLTATVISSTQINLSWIPSTDNVGVAGYRVYRNGSLVKTVTTTTYADTNLTPSTTYTYQVAAFDAAGNVSAQSAAASATTQAAPDTTPPSVPTGLNATAVSSDRIDISWTASTDNVGVAGYRVYRNGSLAATVTDPGYADAGLVPSTTYSYAVSAFDAAGNESGQSSAVSAQTLPLPDQPLAVTFPNGGEVLAAGASYTVTWEAPTDAMTFDLQYSTDGGRSWKSAAAGVIGKKTDWQVPSLKRNSRKCLIKVIGYDAAKRKIGADTSDGAYSIEVTKLLTPNGHKTVKTSVTTATDITWETHATTEPVESVKLFYTTNGGMKWKLIDELPGNPGSYSWKMPEVIRTKDRCMVAVLLKDAKGRTVGRDRSDDFFTMEP